MLGLRYAYVIHGKTTLNMDVFTKRIHSFKEQLQSCVKYDKWMLFTGLQNLNTHSLPL